MEQQQSFNLTSDFLNGFSSMFMKLVFVLILVYIIILIINFFRDKYINKDSTTKNADIIDLMTILNKLFFVSGFGFIIGNIIQVILNRISQQVSMAGINSIGNWDYLTFGTILIFIGISLKAGKKLLLTDRKQ